MQAYTELIPPTGITHAVSLPFLSRQQQNLAVAKTSILEIFSLRQPSGSDISKLSLIASYPLSGTVTALRAVSTSTTKSGGDALLISFKDAKLSLIEWDPDNHRISTISIHYYEGENVHLQPFGPSLAECESVLTVDPSSRCAALKFGPRQLAVLPFRQQGDDLAGEDEVDEEMDDAPPLKRTQTGVSEVADGGEGKQTPYQASFVLSLTALDPGLTQPVDLAFLHEYREPTLGILGGGQQASVALLDERRDCLSYAVFTLDLEQRASTNLVSVPKLPSDLWKVVPLPLPVGGALLVGTNELVHVDQSGKTNAVAVNEFAKKASSLNMVDQAHLNMKLEHCEIEALDAKGGEMLIILQDGSLATLTFKLSGRSVAGLEVTRVSEANGGLLLDASPSCTAILHGKTVFVGSETGDSALLKWSRAASGLSRKRSHAQMLGQEPAKEEDDDSDSGDDDLYGETAQTKKRTMSSSVQANVAYSFEVQDRIFGLGPINNFCFGRSKDLHKDKLQMVAATGRGRASRLAFMSKGINSKEVRKESFTKVKDAWYVNAKAKDAPAEATDSGMLFVYDGEGTKVYDVNTAADDAERYVERTGTEFEGEGETLFVGALAGGSRIVHCRRNEIRTYDAADLSLDGIISQESEDSDVELKIVHTSFCEPYALVLRDDSSISILRADDNGDVEALELEGTLKEGKWISGCLHDDDDGTPDILAYLLADDGSLNLFTLPDLEQVYKAPQLPHLPPVLSQDASQRRFGAKETLTEVLVAAIGPVGMEKDVLIVRNAMDDLTLYEPFSSSPGNGIRYRKMPFTYLPTYDETAASEDLDGRPARLQLAVIGDYRTVVVPGPSPTLILTDSHSLPHAIPLHTISRTRTLVPLPSNGDSRTFALVDAEGALVQHALPRDDDYSTGWAISKLTLGNPVEEVRHVDFHEEQGMYVVATCKDADFYFAPEDQRHEGQDEISLRPQVPRCTLHLLSATTNHIIHSHPMPPLETITSMKIMPLETSEHTHAQRTLLAVGSAAMRGEDMPAKGAITIFELQSVVPDPERPESGIRLHALSREETRGAVTAVEALPGGLVGTAQGQKLMVRGLKEDGSCLPVAFLDAQCHTLGLKTLLNTGMWLAADAWKGVWFGAFTEEPYKLTLLGKSRARMEVLAAEFLPFDEGLFVVVADGEGKLHCLQFDPENPKSLGGQRLLNRGTWNLGHDVVGMRLVPSTLAPLAAQQAALASANANGDSGDDTLPDAVPPSPQQKLHHVLLTLSSGAVALFTPLDESAFRRLGALQTQLTSVLEHACGLNPRAHRAAGEGGASSGVVDVGLLRRLGEVGSGRRAEVLARAGTDGWGWRGDGEVVGGGGLSWL